MQQQKHARRFTVAGIGEILWDLLPGGRQLGGAPANFAYHAHALGAQGVLVSRVGDDRLGRDIQTRIRDLGIKTAHLTVDPERPTGTVDVTLDDKGHPDYVIHENVAWDAIPFTRDLDELAAACHAVCYGTLCSRAQTSRTSIRRFLEATPHGCLRICDVNLRRHYYSADLLRDLLGHASVLKLNEDELPVICDAMGMSNEQSDQERVRALVDRCALKALALTRGGSGSVLATPDAVSIHPGVAARTVDTVGAGDSFTAALAMGLLHGDDLDIVNEHANQVAAFVCTQHGATPRLPAHLVKW